MCGPNKWVWTAYLWTRHSQIDIWCKCLSEQECRFRKVGLVLVGLQIVLRLKGHYIVKQHKYFQVTFLWLSNLCFLIALLELHTLSQEVQGMDIPSKCLVSMWAFIVVGWPSFPHSLQIKAVVWFSFPDGTMFLLLSIIDFTFTSSASKSPLNWSGMATAVEVLLSWTFETNIVQGRI